jgi:hypothetical protein
VAAQSEECRHTGEYSPGWQPDTRGFDTCQYGTQRFTNQNPWSRFVAARDADFAAAIHCTSAFIGTTAAVGTGTGTIAKARSCFAQR